MELVDKKFFDTLKHYFIDPECSGKIFREVNFTKARYLYLKKVEGFRFCEFHRCSFENVDLTATVFMFCKFVHCTFSGVKSHNRIQFHFVQFDSCCFYGVDLTYCQFTNCNFSYNQGDVHTSFDGSKFTNCTVRALPLDEEEFFPIQIVNKYFPCACPESGGFFGYKIACTNPLRTSYAVVKLYIPDDAKRSSAYGRKCRCDKARVVDITALGTNIKLSQAFSVYDTSFVYEFGEWVHAENFDPDRRHECAPGIHFFITEQEAIDYTG